MDCVGLIPCAGKGTRLGVPFSKEMFPDLKATSYRPILMYTIEALKLAGIEQIIITIHPDKSDIMKYLGNGKELGVSISYCMHPISRSLPESVHEAYFLMKGKQVLFSMPDTVITPNDSLLILKKEHENATDGRVITMGAFPTTQSYKYGMISLNGNQITEIIDKPKSTTLTYMWGTMIWEPSFTEELHQFVGNHSSVQKELIFSDALKPFLQQNKVYAAIMMEHQYKDLGVWSDMIHWGKNEDGCP